LTFRRGPAFETLAAMLKAVPIANMTPAKTWRPTKLPVLVRIAPQTGLPTSNPRDKTKNDMPI